MITFIWRKLEQIPAGDGALRARLRETGAVEPKPTVVEG
jgi:hypothetical protein